MKRLTINVKSKPKVISETKVESSTPIKIPDKPMPIPNTNFSQKESFLERTARKLSEGLNRTIGFFITQPVYVRC